jgi:hypothetical protein
MKESRVKGRGNEVRIKKKKIKNKKKFRLSTSHE